MVDVFDIFDLAASNVMRLSLTLCPIALDAVANGHDYKASLTESAGVCMGLLAGCSLGLWVRGDVRSIVNRRKAFEDNSYVSVHSLDGNHHRRHHHKSNHKSTGAMNL